MFVFHIVYLIKMKLVIEMIILFKKNDYKKHTLILIIVSCVTLSFCISKSKNNSDYTLAFAKRSLY